jgi:hypothetical protein
MEPTISRVVAYPDSTDAALPTLFDGYPFLATWIGRTPLRNIAIVPADWPPERLLDLTLRQALTNGLDTRLCLGPDRGFYVAAQAPNKQINMTPADIAVVERLALVERFPASPDVLARRDSLARFADATRGFGYLVGDGLEAGRIATDADIEALSATDADGVPAGLARCPECRCLRGEYLALRGQGNGDMGPRVIRVDCRCENHNRCAGCGRTLAAWRLSSYFWDDANGSVRYLASYCALSHRCP